MTELLLTKGAQWDRPYPGAGGAGPLAVAEALGHAHVAEVLRAHGAKASKAGP